MGDYIGIDIGKKSLDIGNGMGVISIPNERAAIKKWIQAIKKSRAIELIVCEATGGYEQVLAKELRINEIPVLVEHPNKIRAFAKSKGLLAKTDRIDAQLIQAYASVMKPQAKEHLLTKGEEEIRELLKRRNQLLEDKTRETNRLEKEYSGKIKSYIEKHITFLEEQIKSVGKSIKALAVEPVIEDKVKRLTSIPGIGEQTALMMITLLPEMGRIENKSLAALAGVAPFNRDSGKYRGKRFIQGGRSTLRKALYMAAIASVRWNKPLGEFYQRLRAKGKCAKVALVAVMHKLLAVANSVYKRKSVWVETLP